MEGNDISADFVLQRFYVARRLVITERPVLTRVFKVIPILSYEITVNEEMLRRLNNFAYHGALLTLFGKDCRPLEDLDVLDAYGMHPFNNAFELGDRELARELPYRQDIQGVIDYPGNSLMWGRWAFDLENVK